MADQPENLREIFAQPLEQGDSELRWMLVALALADMAWTAAVVAIGHGALWLVIGLNVISGVLLCASVLRLRSGRYSIAGFFWFLAANLAFGVGQVAILWIPLLLRWGIYNGAAFAIGQVIVVAPLVAVAWLMTRRIDRARP